MFTIRKSKTLKLTKALVLALALMLFSPVFGLIGSAFSPPSKSSDIGVKPQLSAPFLRKTDFTMEPFE